MRAFRADANLYHHDDAAIDLLKELRALSQAAPRSQAEGKKQNQNSAPAQGLEHQFSPDTAKLDTLRESEAGPPRPMGALPMVRVPHCGSQPRRRIRTMAATA